MERKKYKISTRTGPESKKKISQYTGAKRKTLHDDFLEENSDKKNIKDLEQDAQTRVSSTSHFVLSPATSSKLYSKREDKRTSDSQSDNYNLNFLHEHYTEVLDSFQSEDMTTKRKLKRNRKEIEAVFDNPNLESAKEKFLALKNVFKNNIRVLPEYNPFDEAYIKQLSICSSVLPRNTLEDSNASSVEILSSSSEMTKL